MRRVLTMAKTKCSTGKKPAKVKEVEKKPFHGALSKLTEKR